MAAGPTGTPVDTRRSSPRSVLARARAAGLAFVCLDGTLVPTDRVAARAQLTGGHHRWYSSKHHAFGGSAQVLTDPTGFPVWVPAVRPGSTHDLTAARELAPHAACGLPVLADKGYTGTGVGVHVPIKHQHGGPPAHRQPLPQLPDHGATCAGRTGQRPARPLARPRRGHRLPSAQLPPPHSS